MASLAKDTQCYFAVNQEFANELHIIIHYLASMKYHNYYIYITTNPDKTVLYTGVTNDLDRRLAEHFEDNNGARKTFAGKYFCYNLIYYEYYAHIEWAIAREKQIKGMSRKKKEDLIAKFNPEWRFLNSPIEIEKGDIPVWIIGEEPWDAPQV